jgi:ubiquinone/menaquinone biosynthesis C-methylase UbiE
MTLAFALRLMASLSEACDYGRMRADQGGDLRTDPAAPADAMGARYDGWADWYDNWNAPSAARNASEVLDFLGAGAGLCLDLGCGTGLYFDVLARSGRAVVGLDRSADQLRIARRRSRNIVQADAAALPFADEALGTVATMWISTDVDDFTAVLAEAARVLAPSGLLFFYGVHPCFNGPHVEWMDDGGIRAHPTYRMAGWHQVAPWWGYNIRRKFGMRHHPLAELINALISAGLMIEPVAELGDRPVPVNLAIRSRKPAQSVRT